ncbi:hypothetical protein CDL12_23561 [Handroanthus impetiginosus]|uniref:NAC domain-containing protein n=1 Tax=Handroanthus impetiginosus TaxID=429701 RepID=A0A2G9GF60_9LAMI|nr:hypothetical protein CDL12_23561 [Handroanthus impetiginosus]
MEDDHEYFPVGFRFYPTEEELVSFFLQNKLNGTRPDIDRVIPVLDIYDSNPSELPHLAGEYCPADGEQWFFFIPRQEREARGGRPNRLTTEGYWKATGSPGDVYSSQNRVIGRKRTMVFYVGRAPSGRKTMWKMNEYKAIASHDHAPSSSSSTFATPQLREEFSLCRIYKRPKCLRAFDRRPPSEAVLGVQAAVAAPHHYSHHEAAAFANQLHNPVAPDVTDNCSDRSSSSGDYMQTNNYQSQFVDSGNNPDLAIDHEPLWDWDRFNLF